MGYSSVEHRLLSRPIEVHWAGWQTNTLKLQQAGWKLSVEERPYDGLMRMCIKHDQLGMIGQTNNLDYSYLRSGADQWGTLPIWQMRHLGGRIEIHSPAPLSWDFKPIDAMPQFAQSSAMSLEDLVHFAPAPLIRTSALVLPEATVDDLLKEILERQEVGKLAYVDNLLFKDGRDPPAHKFHTQIISLTS